MVTIAGGTGWRITVEPAGTCTGIVQAVQVTWRPRWRVVARASPRHTGPSAAHTGDLRRIGATAADARAARPAGHPGHRGDAGAAGTFGQRGRLG